ncbi:actin-binding FH2 [Rozella allomycis CSF55]|uniref:Actin-binding FH2 n=1 Tax=Rozella allomycis (strain CSF55) TaxID=988480 RepID=A0A4P9YBZ5_ROZAC|nr:actin-binding FH2 [Rozella allomycis CSF55]
MGKHGKLMCAYLHHLEKLHKLISSFKLGYQINFNENIITEIILCIFVTVIIFKIFPIFAIYYIADFLDFRKELIKTKKSSDEKIEAEKSQSVTSNASLHVSKTCIIKEDTISETNEKINSLQSVTTHDHTPISSPPISIPPPPPPIPIPPPPAFSISKRSNKIIKWKSAPSLMEGISLWNCKDEESIKVLKMKCKEFIERNHIMKIKTRSNVTSRRDSAIASPIQNQVLDFKKIHGLNVLMRSCKLNYGHIVHFLKHPWEINEETFPYHVMQEILKFLPTDEEMNKLYKSHEKDFSIADSFIFEIGKVEDVRLRLNFLIQMKSIDTEGLIKDLSGCLKNYSRLVHKVESSSNLHRLLHIILVLGNILNGTEESSFCPSSLHSVLKIMICQLVE